jgi:hypothetical protein
VRFSIHIDQILLEINADRWGLLHVIRERGALGLRARPRGKGTRSGLALFVELNDTRILIGILARTGETNSRFISPRIIVVIQPPGREVGGDFDVREADELPGSGLHVPQAIYEHQDPASARDGAQDLVVMGGHSSGMDIGALERLEIEACLLAGQILEPAISKRNGHR